MLKNRLLLAVIMLVVFITGTGYIIYTERPVMNTDKNEFGNANDLSDSTTPSDQLFSTVYSMTDVQAHDLEESCWTSINGSVYDLSTWVSRHPGGAKAIISLCGTDGSERFEQKHGTSTAAQTALVLLKIGTLDSTSIATE
ncbi:hypothetical protein HYV70_03680 [Candidatus Uhrbacteria bacterium]|nr:hypothetical protein [Candidatus Uhrbacteria bacterium]